MPGYNARQDSDGVTHYIYAQDEPMSCALACMFMIENQVEQMTHAGGEERLKDISFVHPGSLLASQLASDNNGLGWGTTVDNAEKTFVDIGVRLTKVARFDPTAMYNNFAWERNRISEGHPALLLVGWYALATRQAGAERRSFHYCGTCHQARSRRRARSVERHIA